MFKKILKISLIPALLSVMLLSIARADVSDPLFFKPEGDSLVATWLNKLGTVTHPIAEINTDKLTVNTDLNIGTAKVGVGGIDMDGEMLFNASEVSIGLDGTSGQLSMLTEQGATDYTATLNPNTGMTSDANFYLPADEPAGTSFITMTAGGVMQYDSSTYLANPMTTIGDIMYGGTAGASARLAGDTTNARTFLLSQSVAGVATAPAWATLTSSDVGLGSVENTALSTWGGSANITTIGTLTGLTVDGKTAFAVSNDVLLADDQSVTCSKTIMHVAGNGAPAVLDTNPSVVDGTADGELCILVGRNDTNTVQIIDGTNVELSGGANFTLANGNSLMLIWDTDNSTWFELSRSAN